MPWNSRGDTEYGACGARLTGTRDDAPRVSGAHRPLEHALGVGRGEAQHLVKDDAVKRALREAARR